MKRLRKLQDRGAVTRDYVRAKTKVIKSLFEKFMQSDAVSYLDGKPSRDRQVWNGILQYVNSDLVTDAEGYEGLVKVFLTLTPDFSSVMDTFRWSDFNDFMNNMIFLGTHQQQRFKNLLLWLCKPKSHPELRVEALDFLNSNAHEEWNIDFNHDPIQNEDFDEQQGEHPARLFVKEVGYLPIDNAICKFIFDYLDDPLNVLPIRICERPGCNKFILPQRTGRKKFCSNLCASLANENKKPRQERTDYAWLHRLEAYSVSVLRKKLRESGDKARLREIETRWPRLADKARAIAGRI